VALFSYMIMVAFAMLSLVMIFAGWGLLFRRVCSQEQLSSTEVAMSALLGWCLIIAMLQIWHFLLPVAAPAFAAVMAVGLAGLGWNARLLVLWAEPRRKGLGACALILCLIALMLAVIAVRQPTNYDTGLYHLAAIRWAHTYPVVPGLANLHGRLGFNCSFFLYAAMLNVGPFVGRCHHLANGALFLAALLPCLWGLSAAIGKEDPLSVEQRYYALFTVPVIVWSMNPNLATSPSPDAAGFLLGMAAGGELIHLLHPDRTPMQPAHGPEPPSTRILTLLVLAAAGITSKLNFAAFGGSAALLAMALVAREPASRVRQCLASAGAVGLLFLLPWMVRGVMLSGYVAYPFTLGAIPVDWRAPAEKVVETASWIKSWARTPNADYRQVLANWDWLLPWSRRMAVEHSFDVLLPLGLTGAGVAWMLIRRIRNGMRIPFGYWLFLAAPAAGLVFWFFSAPAPRFAGACFWVPALGTMALLHRHVRSSGAYIVTFLLFGVAICQQTVRAKTFYNVTWDSGPVRTAPVNAVSKAPGFTVYTPSEEGDDRCWDAPLPCTPYVRENFSLRDPSDMSKGFVAGMGKEQL
jgi:hypothetical protein